MITVLILDTSTIDIFLHAVSIIGLYTPIRLSNFYHSYLNSSIPMQPLPVHLVTPFWHPYLIPPGLSSLNSFHLTPARYFLPQSYLNPLYPNSFSLNPFYLSLRISSTIASTNAWIACRFWLCFSSDVWLFWDIKKIILMCFLVIWLPLQSLDLWTVSW